MKVYVATQNRNDAERPSRKIIGVFSTKANAFTVVEGLAAETQPFDYPDLFQVDVYDVDEAFIDRIAGGTLRSTGT